jgi:hypothetical protein
MVAKISKRSLLPVFVLLCALLACATQAPAAPPATFDVNAIDTYVAQTAEAAAALSAIPMLMLTVTPSLSAPTSTLYSTQTGTPTLDYTFTPVIPVISVSKSTNCRNGPGKVYDYEGALLAGQSAEIFGVDPTGRYFYIRNPDDPNRYCWVWDEYATISGSVAFLQIYTPPPTPTATNTPTPTATPLPAPDFYVAYTSMDTCAGGWWLEFKIKNTGVVDIKSVQIELSDKAAGADVTNLTDGLVDVNGCLGSTIRDTLSAEASAIISSAAFAFNPAGHQLNAKITACSKKGLSGVCAAQRLKFIP